VQTIGKAVLGIARQFAEHRIEDQKTLFSVPIEIVVNLRAPSKSALKDDVTSMMGWNLSASHDAGHCSEQKKVLSSISLSASEAQNGHTGSASTVSTLVRVSTSCLVT
jgi:hypothetical protein